MKITKIVITGGPCAGKTTGMNRLLDEFTSRGYAVFYVSETATDLSIGGIGPGVLATNLDYQKAQMKLQIEKDKVFDEAAKAVTDRNVLILYDRGTIDNKPYMTPEEFAETLEYVGCTEVELRESYDAVFHLVTAAKGAEAFYTTANNTARTETPEEAAALDDLLIEAWTGHPNFRIIDNSTGFEEKISRLIAEIAAFLGEPLPMETERKFLISYPDLQKLEALPNCRKVNIVQTYLKASEQAELRIRQYGENGNYVYSETYKRAVPDKPGASVVLDRRITKDEYLQLLMGADPLLRPVRKDRYYLSEDNVYYEIDVYPFWDDRAILEMDLAFEEEKIYFPPRLKVLREVTGEEEYQDYALAKR